MCCGALTEREDKDGRAGFRSCTEGFREMFSKMSDCCAGRENLPDYAHIMSRMRAGCCVREGENEKK